MYDFKFKPFEEMTSQDYETIGFMSGLEVHQQLFTKTKLFSRANAGLYDYKYNAEILRHMRPTLSEMGEYDGTALMEFKTKKDIIYRINYDSVSTYEMDDTPPFEMNEHALDIAMEIGMLMNSHIVDEIHIARKQYLDGSIPTGFQRTAITSVGGRIPYKDRYIDIIQISIEEDSCREIEDVGHKRIYLADRLGMPLIETVTHPQMKTPQEIAEVNQILRRLARSTGKVRTGIGAGRQDVNVSVRGGTRVEIKGVMRIPYIPRLAYNEAQRQWTLLQLREELKNRGITTETFHAKHDDVTHLLRKSRFQPVSDAILAGKKAFCVTLKGWKELLNWQTQTDTTFAREISDRVRVIACLTTLPNIVHSDNKSDQLPSYEWMKLRKSVGATEEDTLVIVWGSDEDVLMGAQETIIRAKEATIGIPSETRQALLDGTTGFERILPGPQRMYPDTDLPPIKVEPERVAKIRSEMPTPIWERENWYREIGVPEDSVKSLAFSRFARLFEKLVKELDIKPKLAAVVLNQYIKKLRRRKFDIQVLNDKNLYEIFSAYKSEKLPKDAILTMMEKTVTMGYFSVDFLPSLCSDVELEQRVKSSANDLESEIILHPDKKPHILTGKVMEDLRGRLDGSKVYNFVQNYLEMEAQSA